MPVTLCTAMSKRSRQQCRGFAVRGSTKCRMHGGTVRSGIAAVNYKHGRYSKEMPARLAGVYQHALDDTKLTELRDELALTQARVQDLLKRVDSGESGHLWKQLQQAYADLLKAEGGMEQLAAIQEIGKLITRGAADYAAWQEVGKEIDRTQRLAESERKRLVEQQQTITAERAILWMSAIQSVIVKHVTDRDILSRIATDLRALTHRETSKRDLSG